MSDRSRDETIRHPADERQTDQSAQSASGLGRVRQGPGAKVDEDVLNRNAPARYDTPRHYEENNSDDDRGHDR